MNRVARITAVIRRVLLMGASFLLAIRKILEGV